MTDETPATLLVALRTIASGGLWLSEAVMLRLLQRNAPAGAALPVPLTPCEQEVLELMASGASNKNIALARSVTVRTVEYHATHIFVKLNVSSRAAAICWVTEQAQRKLLSHLE